MAGLLNVPAEAQAPMPQQGMSQPVNQQQRTETDEVGEA